MAATLMLALCGAIAMPSVSSSAATAAGATRALAVTGAGVTGISPAFDPAVTRYSVYTAEGSDGQLTVDAHTSDPRGSVQINGARVWGPTTLTGLREGDEISVIITDASGTTGYALVYLPPDFPHLTARVDEAGTSDGLVFLTLATWTSPSRYFEVAVDRHGVPAYFHADDRPGSALDLKPAPGGHYTVFRAPTPEAGRTGSRLVELDGRFQPVRTMSTVGLANTDNHDAILRPDGSRILIGYEPAANGDLDATIQEVDAGGHVVYTWNSADHFDPDTETTNNVDNPDYAHINSVQELPDGDLLVSFRHTSSLMKIAWHAHGAFQRGDIVWRLGGRASDFTFVGDSDGGPCAQHDARMLENGHIVLFDNGSGALGASQSLCVDPANPTGPTVNRPRTRISEYALDDQAGTATLVWHYEVPGRFTLFAGSAQRLAGGNTLVGWAASTAAVATEVAPDGHTVWELVDDDATRWFTYRATKAPVPDVSPPVVAVNIADHLTLDAGQPLALDVRCTDEGGSNLQRCSTSPGTPDTSTPGPHSLRVTAVDGAGNTTVVTRSYVVKSGRPDLKVRAAGEWTERGVARLPMRGALRAFVLRLTNDRARADQVELRVPRLGKAFRVRYLQSGRDVTRSVGNGTWRASLAGGASVELRVVVKRRRTHVPRSRLLTLRASSVSQSSRYDVLQLVLRSRR